MKEPTFCVQTYISDSQYDLVLEEAGRLGIDTSEMIRIIIYMFFESKKK